jgi:RNA-directed DNA polymerase
MKRVGGMVEQILQYDNLLIAFHRASRGKRYRWDVREFQDEFPCKLGSIIQRLSSGEFKFGQYHQFMICDPKERIITAPCFEERLVHHAIMNVCEPVYIAG